MMTGRERQKGSRLRRLVKTGLSYGLNWMATFDLFDTFEEPAKKTVVLCYHRTAKKIERDVQDILPSMLVSQKMLEQQLDCIGQRYRFVSLDDLVSRMDADPDSNERVAALTFDDGYRDVYYNAFPLLKRKAIPAAIFVATDFIGSADLLLHDKLFLLLSRAFSASPEGLWEFLRFLTGLGIRLPEESLLRNGGWSHPKAVSTLLIALPQSGVYRIIESLQSRIRIEEYARELNRALSWDMIQEMHRAGMTIGSHTKSHAVLINENFERIFEETQGSRNELERKLNTEIHHFAYPDGQFNAATIMAATAAGYRYGYTACRHRDPIRPLLTIPRVLLWENSCLDARGRFSPAILNCLVRGLFNFAVGCDRDHALRETNLLKPAAHEFHV